MRRPALLALSLAALAGCGDRLPPEPRLISIFPAEGPAAEAVPVVIFVEHLADDGFVDFDEGAVARAARAWLERGDVKIELSGVERMDARTLRGVIPAGRSPGTFSLSLVDPWDRRVELPSAFRTLDPVRDGGTTDGGEPDAGAADAGGEEPAIPELDGGGFSADGGPCPIEDGCQLVPPLACLRVDHSADEPSRPFTFDASCSRSARNDPSTLRFRFDFESDGVFDTAFSESPVATASYPSAGRYTATVEVTDGLYAQVATRRLQVSRPLELIRVTTGLDEADVAASPTAPGGTGLSLREAILHANALGGPRVITFSPGLNVVAADLPELSGAGATIAGREGVRVTFQQPAAPPDGGNKSCLELGGDGQSILGLFVEGCRGHGISVKGGGAQVADTELRPGGGGEAGAVKFQGPDGGLFGPGNLVRGFRGDRMGTGLQVKAGRVTVRESRFLENDSPLSVQAGANHTLLERNQFQAVGNHAVEVGFAEPLRIRFNTFHDVKGSAVVFSSLAPSTELVDNVFSRTDECALSGGDARFGPVNLFHHVKDGCPAQVENGDPRFYDPSRFDLRLRPDSAAVNRARTTDVDVNGPYPGLYFGFAPDVGAHESPY